MTTIIEEYRTTVRDGVLVDGARNPRKRQSSVHATGVSPRYPVRAKAFPPCNGHVLHGTTLSARHRARTMLRVAPLRRCADTGAQHVLPAADTGITATQIARVIETPDSPHRAPLDRALLAAVDELLADAEIGDPTWHEPARKFHERQLMDIVHTVGTYELVAMTFRSFRVEPEAERLAQLPQAGKPPW